MNVYVLYGVADRDPNEFVCMFFETMLELDEFTAHLPGRYDIMTISGVNYAALTVESIDHCH